MSKVEKEDRFPPEIMALIKDGLLTVASDPELVLTYVPTGIAKLDDMLGGGFVRGCTSLAYGEFSTGKTYLALRTIAEAQKRGELCAFIDAEQTFNPEWATRVGVDVEKLIVAKPKTGEKAIDLTVALLKTQEISFLVLDSLAGLIPTSEIDQDTDKGFGAIQAKLITKALRRFLGTNKKTALLCLNHVRTQIGNVPGETVPGGRAQKQYAITTIKVGRHEWIKEKPPKNKRIGFKMRIELKKSKSSAPEEFCILPFYYDLAGIDTLAVDIEYAIELGIIKQRSSSFDYEGVTYIGKQKLYDHFEDDEEGYAVLRREIQEKR